jgi:hypothetical protein
MGRKFAHWAIVFFWQIFENNKVTFLGYLFLQLRLCRYYFGQKPALATFWGIFSQTHLVTLVKIRQFRDIHGVF